MKTLPIDDHNQGIIFHKLGPFFNFWKRAGETLELPLKNLKRKLRNRNVAHVPADYAKKFSNILGLLIRNMVSKNVNLLCFTTIFLKNLEMSSHVKKSNYKVIIENVFSQPELFRVISIKCFSEKFRTLPNFWCWEFCEIIYLILPLNTVLMFDEILNLSLHLPSVDFN